MDLLTGQWVLVIVSSFALLAVTPFARTKEQFFRGRLKESLPNAWVLCSSLVISWLFAKSITNAANLGLAFGWLGGLAYAAYYLSFITAGWVIYQLRTRGGFMSIHHFLRSRFGSGAIVLFSLLIAFRLFNEVWSNTMVIGTYFGEAGSDLYYAAILVFTALTLLYSLKGGMSSSILTDVIQMILFGVLLAIILLGIGQLEDGSRSDTVTLCGSSAIVERHAFSLASALAGGGNLLLVAIVQSLSYPFHDPVLTDRGFISDPKTSLKAYLWAAPLGGLCIFLFSFVGVFARQQGLSGEAPVEVAKLFGLGMMLAMNFIMITSAASTLDSTFSSFSKLLVEDLGKAEKISLSRGRWAMLLLALLGSVPIFFGAEILSATTISGTMVIGLAPVFLLWRWPAPPLSLYLSVGAGLLVGLLLLNGLWPRGWHFSEGKYADLLSANLVGTISCFVLYSLPMAWHSKQQKTKSELKIKGT